MIKKITCLSGLLLVLSATIAEGQTSFATVNSPAGPTAIQNVSNGATITNVDNITNGSATDYATINVPNTSDGVGFDAEFNLNSANPYSISGIYYVGIYVSNVSDTAALDSIITISTLLYPASGSPGYVMTYITGFQSTFTGTPGNYSGNVWVATTGETFNGLEMTLEGDLDGTSGGTLSNVDVYYGYALTVPPGSASPYQQFGLPVKLTDFSVALNAKEMPELYWNTSSEQNSSYFEVERSADGDNFTDIGRVAAQGTTSISHDYAFTDATALAGVNYYRLRMVDLDGNFTFSKIVSISVGDQGLGIIVAPNPIQHSANLIFNVNKAGNYRVDIINMSGQVIKSQEMYISSQNQTVPFTRSANMSAGIYILHAVNIFTGETYDKKILLQ